jgi:hypothetical protein
MRFLVALGQDVQIVVKPHRDSRQPAQLKSPPYPTPSRIISNAARPNGP